MDPHAQQRYQVRFDWGAAGARRIARDAHVVVVVDELDGHGAQAADEAVRMLGAALDPARPVLLRATSAGAEGVAARILGLQQDLGGRCMIAIIAAGGAETDGLRFAVEDLLAAGAVVDALARLGIDASSPEAAAACAAFVGLRRALGHLTSASSSAREIESRGRPGEFSTPA